MANKMEIEKQEYILLKMRTAVINAISHLPIQFVWYHKNKLHGYSSASERYRPKTAAVGDASANFCG
jgi:hypothetical protein